MGRCSKGKATQPVRSDLLQLAIDPLHGVWSVLVVWSRVCLSEFRRLGRLVRGAYRPVVSGLAKERCMMAACGADGKVLSNKIATTSCLLSSVAS